MVQFSIDRLFRRSLRSCCSTRKKLKNSFKTDTPKPMSGFIQNFVTGMDTLDAGATLKLPTPTAARFESTSVPMLNCLSLSVNICYLAFSGSIRSYCGTQKPLDSSKGKAIVVIALHWCNLALLDYSKESE